MAETRQTAFLALAAHLAQQNYTFICPTPDSQARIVQKRTSDPATRYSTNLEDFFGWCLPADEKILLSLLPSDLFHSLREATIISAPENGSYKTSFRLSNLYLPSISQHTEPPLAKPLYYIHSAHPTTASDAVFFGPDAYFFLSFLRPLLIQTHLSDQPHPPLDPRTIIDVCCGSGAGAIHLSRAFPASKVLGLDLNTKALELGRINAQLADCDVEFAESDLYDAVEERTDIDVIACNPPYIASSDDADVPIYAAGGGQGGLDLPLRIVERGVEILADGGLLIMYTGVPIEYRKPGHDPFLERLKEMTGAELVEYTIIHPDMWPEEVGKGAYAEVGRIQVVGAVLRKKP